MYIFFLFNLIMWLWAAVLFTSAEPILPTPLSQFYLYSDHPGLTALLLVFSAATALMGLKRRWLWWLLPQECTALIVSIGALIPVFTQRYPDGTQRGWRFILADQALAIGLGIFHTLSVIDVTFWTKRRTWWM